MKALGISAVLLTVLSFLFWLISWVYWTFLYDTVSVENQKVVRNVMQGVSMLSSLTEFLAILLVAIGLILAAKNKAAIQPGVQPTAQYYQ